MAVSGSKPTLFGREDEKLAISHAIGQVALSSDNRMSKVILLSGMSGVGKTALAQFAIAEAKTHGFDVFETACEPFHEGMSFFPVRELVRQMAGGKQTAALVADMFGEGTSQAEMAMVSESVTADPSSRREALVATFTNVVLGRFQDPNAKPAFLFLDDLEYLDTGSADALICLVSRMAEGRIIIFGAYRSDKVTTSQHPVKSVLATTRRVENVLSEIRIMQFDQLSFYSLVDVLLPGDTKLPLDFYDKLYKETEGNPLFTREVLRMLSTPQQPGGTAPLAVRDGNWTYEGDIDQWDIPATVEGAIASRLDILNEEERKNLEFAAVIGRRFAFEVLHGIMQQGEEDLLDSIERFLDFDIIRELERNVDIFEFSHGKICDVLYNSISGRRRRIIHGQVAEVLSDLMSSANEDWDAIIGGHMLEAAKPTEAFPYLLRAARNAKATGSDAESANLYRKARSASDKAVFEGNDSKTTIELELAEALIATSEVSEAEAILEQLTAAGTPKPQMMKAYNLLGDALLYDGEIKAAFDAYTASQRIAEEIGDTIGLCEVLCDLSELHGREYEKLAGVDPEKAEANQKAHISSTDLAYENRDKIEPGPLKARIYRNKAKLSRVTGDLQHAYELHQESLANQDQRIGSHRFLIPYIKTLRLLGNIDEANLNVNKILDWSAQVNSHRSRAIAMHIQAMIQMTQASSPAELEQALATATGALRIHQEIGYKQGIRETETIQGEIFIRMGKEQEALQKFKSAHKGSVSDPMELAEAVASELAANGEVDRAEVIRKHFGVGNNSFNA